jgi:hypothetical protein
LRDEKNRQRDILVAEIRAAGMGSMVDIDQNMQSDYIDAMKDIKDSEQFQDQMNLQREKETNRQNADSTKAQIEREKLQVQREIANKQLEIARENKTKSELKADKKI